LLGVYLSQRLRAFFSLCSASDAWVLKLGTRGGDPAWFG
jgi:hypothetical protein